MSLTLLHFAAGRYHPPNVTAFSSTVTLFGLSTKSQDKLFPLVGLRPRRYVTNVISYCSVRKLNSQIVLCRRAPYPSVHASRRKATNVRRRLFGWQASRLNDALCDHPRSAEGNPGKCLFGANPRGCIYLVAEKRERERRVRTGDRGIYNHQSPFVFSPHWILKAGPSFECPLTHGWTELFPPERKETFFLSCSSASWSKSSRSPSSLFWSLY